MYTLQDLCVRAVHTVLARRYIKASAEPCIHDFAGGARGERQARGPLVATGGHETWR